VGVVVGSFGRPRGHRRSECAAAAEASLSRTPVQPQPSQPVVTQPGYSAPEPAPELICTPRRAP